MTGGTRGIPTSETSKNPSVDCSEPGYAALSDDGRRNALNGHLKRWLPSGAGAPGCPFFGPGVLALVGKKRRKRMDEPEELDGFGAVHRIFSEKVYVKAPDTLNHH